MLSASRSAVGVGQVAHVDGVTEEPADPEELAERYLVLRAGQPHLPARLVVEGGVVPEQGAGRLAAAPLRAADQLAGHRTGPSAVDDAAVDRPVLVRALGP